MRKFKNQQKNLFLKYIKITRKLSLYQIKKNPKIRSFVISKRFFLLLLKNRKTVRSELRRKKPVEKNDQIYACVGFCVSWAVYFVACIVTLLGNDFPCAMYASDPNTGIRTSYKSF